MPTKSNVGPKTGKAAIGHENCILLITPQDCLEADDILTLVDMQVEDQESVTRANLEEHIRKCTFCKGAYDTILLARKLAAEVEVLETVATLLQRTPQYVFPLADTGDKIKRLRRSLKNA